MNTIKVCCVDHGDIYPPSLVFDTAWDDWNELVASWDAHSGHGGASIDWVEHHRQASDDVAQDILATYIKLYEPYQEEPVEYRLVGIDEFVNIYWGKE